MCTGSRPVYCGMPLHLCRARKGMPGSTRIRQRLQGSRGRGGRHGRLESIISMRCCRKDSHLPNWHRSPVHCGGHSHRNPPTRSKQVPPCSHGPPAHSSMSVTRDESGLNYFHFVLLRCASLLFYNPPQKYGNVSIRLDGGRHQPPKSSSLELILFIFINERGIGNDNNILFWYPKTRQEQKNKFVSLALLRSIIIQFCVASVNLRFVVQFWTNLLSPLD